MRPMAESLVRYRIPYLQALAITHEGEAQGVGELSEAASIAETLGLPGELWQLYAKLGETQKATEIVGSLAKRIADEGMRTHFVSAVTAHIGKGH